MQKVYNEHMRGIDEEIVTLETKIRNTNIGYTMLQKLGWKDGEGLGARGQGERTNNDLNEKILTDHFHLMMFSGRANPIPFEVKNDSLGLGKASLDRTVIEATVSQRRDLDSERLLRETEEQRRTREVRCWSSAIRRAQSRVYRRIKWLNRRQSRPKSQRCSSPFIATSVTSNIKQSPNMTSIVIPCVSKLPRQRIFLYHHSMHIIIRFERRTFAPPLVWGRIARWSDKKRSESGRRRNSRR